MSNLLLSPEDYLKLCQGNPLPILDVRAPVEFQEGHIPLSTNLPILNNEERHLVGSAYKTEGNEAATRLGHSLVAPHKEERVKNWLSFLSKQANPVLTCWRGGDRSRIAQEWLKEKGLEAPRLQGGYKALRHELIAQFPRTLQGYSLSGLTGTGKTAFIQSLNHPAAIDLESFANHRGSSFGGFGKDTQPSQSTFENALGLALIMANFPTHPILLESESRMIGRIVIPKAFFEQMRAIPRIILETPLEQRLQNIFREYVLLPLETTEQLETTLLQSMDGIRDRLGGLLHSEIQKLIKTAFTTDPKNPELHYAWITALLKNYYDPLYEHSLIKFNGTIAKRGSAAELKEWLTKQTDFFSR